MIRIAIEYFKLKKLAYLYLIDHAISVLLIETSQQHVENNLGIKFQHKAFESGKESLYTNIPSPDLSESSMFISLNF